MEGGWLDLSGTRAVAVPHSPQRTLLPIVGTYSIVGEGKRRRSRLLKAAAWSLVVAVVAFGCAAWLGYKATIISAELSAAKQLVPKLRNEILQDNVAAASVTVADLRGHTSRAREATADPLWTIAGTLPWIGANFEATREVATSAHDVTQLAAEPLVGIFKTTDWKAVVPSGQGIDLQPLVAATPRLSSAAHAVDQSSDRLNKINVDSLLPQVSAPLREIREQLLSLRDGLNSAADAARLLPAMMGERSPRHYLLLVQNNAESRSTGGIPGALAVITLDNGKLSLDSQTSASAMGAFNPLIKVDAEQRAIYSGRLGKFMQDVNLTPDFPTAAQTAQAMWKAKTGEQLDGVLSIDPVALSYILDATGPVRISNAPLGEVAGGGHLPTELTTKNVVSTLLSDVYKKIPEPGLQDVYFAGVAQGVFSKISAPDTDSKKLIDGLTRGTSEGRILVWSSSPKEQAIIEKNPLSGSISGPSISSAQFGVYFNDGTGAKMDYYVKRTVQLVTQCPRDDYLQIKVRVTSTNTAPNDAATSLPDYVTGGGAFGIPEGTVQTNIVAYGPVQAHVESVMADGKKISFASQLHSGRPVGTVTVALPPGKSSTVEFLFDKIVQDSQPQLFVTPTVQPVKDVRQATSTKTCLPAS